jgi:hypothetical protein
LLINRKLIDLKIYRANQIMFTSLEYHIHFYKDDFFLQNLNFNLEVPTHSDSTSFQANQTFIQFLNNFV